VKVWTVDEANRLLQACGEVSPAILPLVVFLLNTGCRKGEALALTWDHVDLPRGMIRIWPSEEWQPKNGKPREVPISKALLPFLTGARTSEKWVFPCASGGRYASWPKLQFDRARKRAGLTGGPHTCRHTYASHFLKVRPDLFLLAQVLGHSEIAVTRRYSHLLPEHLERARDAVNFSASISRVLAATA
jgi:integrase